MKKEQTTHTKRPDKVCTDEAFFRDINIEFLIHELKDPISVIETAVRILLEKPNKYGVLTDRQKKTLNRALRNAKKARDMLADLLEVGRSDTGCFQCCRFDPVAVVDDVFIEVLEAVDNGIWEVIQEIGPSPAREELLHRRGIQLAYNNRDTCIEICQDETKFRQIVANLIKNAFQHRNQLLEICIDYREDNLIVEVIDDGPGVDSRDHELIFKRYTQLKSCVLLSRNGHGLGLAGARILARHLGGDITIKSRRGAGTVFCLSLPLKFSNE